MTENERQQRLIALCTPDFLAKVTEAARLVGWSVDYVEVGAFLERLYESVDTKPPETIYEPYEISYP